MFRIPDNQIVKSQGFGEHRYGELIVATGSRVSRKTVKSACQGQAYQDSSKSQAAITANFSRTPR